MSVLHRKLAKAKAALAAQETQTTGAATIDPVSTLTMPTPPPAARTATPVAQNTGWTQKRTRGRPRLAFAKSRMAGHPVAEFCITCLVPEEAACEYVGSAAKRMVETVRGDSVPVLTTYTRLTLLQAYFQFLKEHRYPEQLPRTFTGLLMKACLELGWGVRRRLSGDRRLWIIQGISIKGQPLWNGDERNLPGHVDRKRWLKKSHA